MHEIKEFGPVVFEKKIFVATEQKWAAMAFDYIQLPITQSKVIEQRPFEQTYESTTLGAILGNIKQFGFTVSEKKFFVAVSMLRALKTPVQKKQCRWHHQYLNFRYDPCDQHWHKI